MLVCVHCVYACSWTELCWRQSTPMMLKLAPSLISSRLWKHRAKRERLTRSVGGGVCAKIVFEFECMGQRFVWSTIIGCVWQLLFVCVFVFVNFIYLMEIYVYVFILCVWCIAARLSSPPRTRQSGLRWGPLRKRKWQQVG